MNSLTVPFILDDNAILPEYKTDGAAAMDLCALQHCIIPPDETVLVKTGLKVEIPEGYVGLVFMRSGLAFKHQLTLMNGVGVIDSDYRGDIGLLVHNHSDCHFEVGRGDRMGQIMLMPFTRVNWTEATFLEASERQEGGFGSTGTH